MIELHGDDIEQVLLKTKSFTVVFKDGTIKDIGYNGSSVSALLRMAENHPIVEKS